MSYIRGTPLHIKPGAKLTVRLEYPYQSGTQLSQGRYEATWNGTAEKWIDEFTGAELNIPMPRLGHEDPQQVGQVVLNITQDPADDDSSTARLVYDAGTWGETAAGELNLTVNPRPIAWVATATLQQLQGDLTTLQQQATTATQDAEAAAAAAAAAADRANAVAGSLEAVGLIYAGQDDEGYAVLATVDNSDSLVYEDMDWGIGGVITTPVLITAGGY